jgi:hypothetical protein
MLMQYQQQRQQKQQESVRDGYMQIYCAVRVFAAYVLLQWLDGSRTITLKLRDVLSQRSIATRRTDADDR